MGGTRLHPEEQLSLIVREHPALQEIRDDGREPWLTGSLKITGSLHCPHDINSGDELTVTVADADGNVIAGGKLIGRPPHMDDIKDRGAVIGTERVNRVEVA
jgi:hypothetical protein